MKKPDFLGKLKKEGKLNVVDPSEEICKSYLSKSEDCIKSAKLLLQNNLFENSVSMSYYSMYNSLIAALFKIGIKCENHTGSILLLKKLFGRVDLHDTISVAKKERIEKQYYITSKDDFSLTKESAEDIFRKAEILLLK